LNGLTRLYRIFPGSTGAGAFAAGAEAQLTGRLTACAGSCGPGSLHFINGI